MRFTLTMKWPWSCQFCDLKGGTHRLWWSEAVVEMSVLFWSQLGRNKCQAKKKNWLQCCRVTYLKVEPPPWRLDIKSELTRRESLGGLYISCEWCLVGDSSSRVFLSPWIVLPRWDWRLSTLIFPPLTHCLWPQFICNGISAHFTAL